VTEPRGDTVAPVVVTPVEQENPIDWERLLQTLGGDETFARELVTLFVESGTNSIEEIANALERGDYEQLGAKAHELKGASSNLQAIAASTAASRLEVAARNGDVDQVAGLANELKTEVTRAIEFLRNRVA
jgi:HPt (histidine-containing phosphotransfer) domain-containing protein